MKEKSAIPYIVLLVLTILSQVSAFASTGQETASVFLILPIPESTDEPEVYKNFFFDAISIELDAAGARTISSDIVLNAETATIAYNTDTDKIDDTAIYSFAEQNKADFVLVCVYDSEDRRMRLKFLCYDVKSEQILSEIEEEAPLDLAIDQTIAKSIKQVLRSAQAQIVLVPATEKTANAEESADDPTESDAEDVALVTELETPIQIIENTNPETKSINGTRDQLPVPPISTDGLSTDIQESPARVKRFTLSFGYSPFFPIGKSAEYIKNAQMPALTTGLNFYISRLKIRTGIYSAFCWFEAEGSLAESDNMLIPAGIHIDLTGSGIELISLLLRLSGGPAFFGINVDETGYRFKIVPYALGTIGILAALDDSYGLSLELSFSACFEPDYPIIGYMPGLRFYING